MIFYVHIFSIKINKINNLYLKFEYQILKQKLKKINL